MFNKKFMMILLCVFMITSNLVFSQTIVKAKGIAAVGWQQSGGTWHYLNTNGTMVTGWILSGAKWYYLNSSGTMITGWILNGGKWYYLNSSGDMATSKWLQSGIAWYYLNVVGDMAVNTTTPDGFKVDINGVWIPLVPSVVAVIGITLNKIKDDLFLGATDTLIDNVSPTNGTNKTVTWTSLNNSIVTVDNTGKLTAVGVGSTIITVTTDDESKTASCTVNVSNISLNKTTDSLKVGGTDTLIASLFPVAPSNDTVTWTTSNKAIVAIDSNGKVIAVSKGTAIITATAIIAGGSYMTTCMIIVTEKTNLTFAIDIGHNSAYDTGAVGLRTEDNCTKEVGTKVMAKLISLGYNVIDCKPTNPISTTDSLQQRCDAANAANADYYVAIHFNIFNGAANGSEVYIFSDVIRTKAQQVLNNIVNLGYIDRGIKYETYYVLRNTDMPSMLIECSFLDSARDMSRYNSDAFADAIVNGLISSN